MYKATWTCCGVRQSFDMHQSKPCINPTWLCLWSVTGQGFRRSSSCKHYVSLLLRKWFPRNDNGALQEWRRHVQKTNIKCRKSFCLRLSALELGCWRSKLYSEAPRQWQVVWASAHISAAWPLADGDVITTFSRHITAAYAKKYSYCHHFVA